MLPFFTSDLKTFDFIDANVDKKLKIPKKWFLLQWQLVHLIKAGKIHISVSNILNFILMQFRHVINIVMECLCLFSQSMTNLNFLLFLL